MRKTKKMITPYVSTSGRHGCIKCMACVASCPRGVLMERRRMWTRRIIAVHPDLCAGCDRCVRVCLKGIFKLKKSLFKKRDHE